MEIVFGIIFNFIPLLVIVGIIAAIVAAVRRRSGAEEEPGIGTLRRLYYYGLSFVALMVAATGIILLVDYVADRLFGPKVLADGEIQLALGLALTLVGTPIWFLHWVLAQRAIRQFLGETRGLSRRVYLYLVLGISGVLAAVGLVSLLRWLLGDGSFNGTHLAFPLVWGGLWAFHWRVEDLEGQTTELARSVRRLYVYVTSLYGLGMLTTGVGIIVAQLFQEGYGALFATEFLLPSRETLWSDTTRIGIAVALVGGVYWWWHWHRVYRGDTESVLRQVYLYLFAILGGAIAVVVSLSILLFGVLQWLIGQPDVTGASAHFQFLPSVMAAVVTGAWVWGYHWAVVRQEAPIVVGGMLAARRVYHYLVAALGLGTLAAGLAILFPVVLGVLVPEARERLTGTDWWRNPLTLALTLLVVGTPLWRFYWFGAQREMKAGGTEERTALSRRVFIYGVFCIAILVTLGNLSALLFMFLRDLLEGELSTQVLRDAKWSIGMLVMAGTISVYYWLVLQEDRRAVPATVEAPTGAPPVRKVIIALASEASQPFVQRLEARLGMPVRLWRRLDPVVGVPAVSEEELSLTQGRIAEAPGDHILLTVDASGVRVIPYQEW